MSDEYTMKVPFDVDGKPIHIGDVVYGQSDGKEWKVYALGAGEYPIFVRGCSREGKKELKPKWLSHEKPITQEDIYAYIGKNARLMPAFFGFDSEVKNIMMVPYDVVMNAINMHGSMYKRKYGIK